MGTIKIISWFKTKDNRLKIRRAQGKGWSFNPKRQRNSIAEGTSEIIRIRTF